MWRRVRDYVLTLAVPWAFCLFAFVLTHQQIDKLQNDKQVWILGPADQIIQTWLVCTMTGAFLNKLLQDWRGQKRKR